MADDPIFQTTGSVTLTDCDISNERLVLNDPLTFSCGITLSHGMTSDWELSGEILDKKEVAMLRALIKLLVDQDLYDTLMETLGMDADAAMATAFRGGK
jgi:hypothetical protein